MARQIPGATISTCPVAHEATRANDQATCPVGTMASAFDPFEDGYLQDPAEYVRWSRDQMPVFFSPKLGYWVVTRYDDIKAIFRDNITFSPSIALEKITPVSDEANAVLGSYNYAMNRTLVNEDEPAHMPRRRLLLDPFTPAELKCHEPIVRQLAREYVDRFIDSGKADLVEQMLWEATLTVAAHFLGVPQEDMENVRKYSIAHTVNTWGRPKPEEQLAVAHAVGNFWQLAGKILDKMRQDPSGPGWMQYGIRKQKEHPEVVTDSYLHSMMMAGLVAAHETTANATANALKLLLQHPTAWKDVCEDPRLIPNAVEECLRQSGSIVAWRRLTTKPAQVGGADIPAGSKLLIVLASANHDERHFAAPELFDIRRDNSSEHLSFGYGSHQCMGKNIARMEMQIFIEEFARRLPHMRLSEQKFTYLPNTSFRGPEHLWVEWNPALNPERQDPLKLRSNMPVLLGEKSRSPVARVAVVDRITTVAAGIVKLRLISGDGSPIPRWSPGAHIDIECGSSDVTRRYSLCGNPADTEALEIAVLRERESRGGSAWIHASVKAGDQLKYRGPRNHFRMDESASKAIFIAGGIGITPIAAMALRARQLGMNYHLHYCGRSHDSMALVDELAALHGSHLSLYVKEKDKRADFRTILSRPDPDARIYACGPARMLAALEEYSQHWPADSLCVEHFQSTPGIFDPSTELPFSVELKDSGIVIQVNPGQTLLDALRKANIDIQSDCQEGLCGSCEVKVLDGEIDHRDTVLTRSERAANDRMMSCCSRAKSRKLLLDL